MKSSLNFFLKKRIHGHTLYHNDNWKMKCSFFLISLRKSMPGSYSSDHFVELHTHIFNSFHYKTCKWKQIKTFLCSLQRNKKHFITVWNKESFGYRIPNIMCFTLCNKSLSTITGIYASRGKANNRYNNQRFQMFPKWHCLLVKNPQTSSCLSCITKLNEFTKSEPGFPDGGV